MLGGSCASRVDLDLPRKAHRQAFVLKTCLTRRIASVRQGAVKRVEVVGTYRVETCSVQLRDSWSIVFKHQSQFIGERWSTL
jgi:hypothetical protein